MSRSGPAADRHTQAVGRAAQEVGRPASPGPADEREQGPSFSITRRRAVLLGLSVLGALAALYFVLPQIAGLNRVWHELGRARPGWLLVGAGCTVGMFGGYVVLFSYVYGRAGARLSLAESYQITMAGLAASRVLSAGGAGGVVLTAWALRRAGMPRRTVADRTVTFLVLTYAVYLLVLAGAGLGLAAGVLPGEAPLSMTLVPGGLSLVACVLAASIALVPADIERRLHRHATRSGRSGRLARRLGTVPATASAGIRDALVSLRSGDPALLGSVAYWAFQVAALWASLRAFGQPPAVPVLIVAFFVGMLGNLLPLPGGVGGVDGGMIGALVACGVGGSLAVVGVLIYRTLTFWLPTVPGVIAYLQLRRTVARWELEPGRGLQPG